jgi:type VI secretion system secreted protein VgrG
MQVLVGFLNGDPDHPLIVGCLRDAEQLPPYPLPEQKTRSVFSTRSTPGGQGGNELRIDDRQGAEQVYLHAQRNWEQHISHDQTLRIGNASRSLVEGNRYSEARGETHRIVQGETLSEVRGNDHLTIDGSQHLTLGDGQFVDAGQEIHLRAGDTLVIEAGSELSIQAGGSFITLDAGGVALVGAQVKLNAGGSAGKGSPAQPLAPSIPQADSAPASVNHKPPVAETPAPAPSPSQLAVARTARKLGASRCPVCEACAEGSCTP